MNWKPVTSPKATASFVPMFRQPTNRFLPSAKNTVTGVILPMFSFDEDRYKMGTDAWRLSHLPYRSADKKDEKGHNEVLVPCAFVYVHSRMGPREDDFVSALSRKDFLMRRDGDSIEDPVIDIRAIANQDGGQWKYLTAQGSGKEGGAAVRWPSTKCVFNFVGTSVKDAGQPPKVGPLIMSKTAHPEFVRLMNITRMPGQVPHPRDPEWPDYLYGDVTNPNRPLEVKTIQRISDTNDKQKYTGWMFSHNEVSLMGAINAPVITQEVLRARLDIFDSAIYNILEYQELLDRIVSENWFPIELVRQACGGKGNIGGVQHTGQAQPPRTEQQFRANEQHVNAAYPAQQPAPAYQAPQPAPYQPTAQDEIPMDHKYWVSGPQGVIEASREQVQSMVNIGGTANFPVMAGNQQGGWRTAADFGFAPPTPPAPPSPPAPPTPPAPPAPPSPPAPPAPPAQQPMYPPVTPPPHQRLSDDAAPWGPPAAAPAPAAPEQPAVSPLTSLPFYDEISRLSAREQSDLLATLTSQLTSGQLDQAGYDRLSTVGALISAPK